MDFYSLPDISKFPKTICYRKIRKKISDAEIFFFIRYLPCTGKSPCKNKVKQEKAQMVGLAQIFHVKDC